MVSEKRALGTGEFVGIANDRTVFDNRSTERGRGKRIQTSSGVAGCFLLTKPEDLNASRATFADVSPGDGVKIAGVGVDGRQGANGVCALRK